MTLLLVECFGALLQYPSDLYVQVVKEPYRNKLCSGAKRKRSSKRSQRVMNKGDIALMEYHAAIQDALKGNYDSLISAAKAAGLYPLQSVSSTLDCSSASLASLCDLDALVSLDIEAKPLHLEKTIQEEVDLFGHVVCNGTDSDITVNAWSCQFVIPSQSSFLLSDFGKLKLLVAHAEVCKIRYDLIVIDPPWENRSVRRGKKYEVLSHEKLLEIPISSLAATGGLIVMWVTNKRRLAGYVQEVLFPAWGVQKVAEWHWIKVTCSGELVTDMDSKHKKPYETIILGKFTSSIPFTGSLTTVLEHTHEEIEPVGCVDSECISPPLKRLRCSSHLITPFERVLPKSYSIVCAASKLHSQKPYLGDLLKEYMCKDPECLELFARNLHRGWTSWGNEVLKMQQTRQGSCLPESDAVLADRTE